jgi:4-hydroxy-3-methylbut-2-en-1-yl diphosphate reductase
MNITIDPHSGFCFGVVYAIEIAERELKLGKPLYCLGDIVHNNMEVNRLKEQGLVIIDHEDLKNLMNSKVLIRAHGEPPETYRIALQNNLCLIDASCPIVLKLQNEIQHGYHEIKRNNGQIVIFGKEGHAEVNGLKGQTLDGAIVISHVEDIDKIDFFRPIRLYSQTTMSIEGFQTIVKLITQKLNKVNPDGVNDFVWDDSICRQVSNRSELLQEFSSRYQVIIFVSGEKSSNGMFLYQICKNVNPKTFLVSKPDEIQASWFQDVYDVGVCGATSTPMWLMQEVAQEIRKLNYSTCT